LSRFPRSCVITQTWETRLASEFLPALRNWIIPNLAARSLVTGRTYLVGLVISDLLHPFFAEITKSLSEVLRKSGYYLIISSSDEDPDLEEQEINHLLARRLDALVVASCRSTGLSANFVPAARSGFDHHECLRQCIDGSEAAGTGEGNRDRNAAGMCPQLVPNQQ
jgi:hypothetical protein